VCVPLNHHYKELIGRGRPDAVEVLAPFAGHSFPSGHAMSAAAVYGLLAILAWTFIRDHRLRVVGAGLPALLALGVGISRIYLGAHWLSDVLAGWAAGLLLALLLGQAHEALVRRTTPEPVP
jgi:undecaprenyl-diphosphatase